MTTIVAMGIDPGPTPGLVRLVYLDNVLVGRSIVQCTPDVIVPLLVAFSAKSDPLKESYLGVEKFVMKGKYSATGAGKITQQQVGQFAENAQMCGFLVCIRPAVEVKRWATDERLDAAGLLEATKGMRHAKDAARHALFTAVADGRVPDPLSRRARGPQT